MYGVFICYLNVPAYISAAAGTLATFPWTFKLVFAVLSDTLPIAGYRRKSYMVLGWFVSATFLIALAALPLPEPYYCRRADGTYDMTRVCNAAAASSGMPFAILMMLAGCGYVLADVAADALTVTYARREPLAQRGRTQTSAYLVREIGKMVSQLLVGFGMNGYEYNGSFAHALSFNSICGILSVPCLVMVPLSWLFVEEQRSNPEGVGGGAKGRTPPPPRQQKPPGPAQPQPQSRTTHGGVPGGKGSSPTVAGSECGAEGPPAEGLQTAHTYWSVAYRLLSSGAMFEVLLYSVLSNAVGGLGTTAGPEVQRVWAGVQNLQNQLFALLGQLLFAWGLWLVRERYLGASWRLMTALTTVVSNLIDMPFTFLTIFNVVRNQYFFISDELILAIPNAAGFIVSTYVMVEVAEPGTEAITYGLLTTAANLGSGPVSSVISNSVFGAFRPSLSDSANYVTDAPSFRSTVAMSYVLSYAFSFASLLFLPLLPNQRADAQLRKGTRPRSRWFVYSSLCLIGALLIYSLAVSLLTMMPSMSCLPIAGGQGCSVDP